MTNFGGPLPIPAKKSCTNMNMYENPVRDHGLADLHHFHPFSGFQNIIQPRAACMCSMQFFWDGIIPSATSTSRPQVRYKNRVPPVIRYMAGEII